MKTLRIKFPHNEEQELEFGKPVVLLGANGAGKTTLFNLLTGVYEPSEGTVTLDGTVLNGKDP